MLEAILLVFASCAAEPPYGSQDEFRGKSRWFVVSPG